MKKPSIDVNNLAGFYDWIRNTFNWVDPAVKGYMKRAWCARGKIDRQSNQKGR